MQRRATRLLNPANGLVYLGGVPGVPTNASLLATFNTDGSIKSLNGYTQITSASNERQLRFAMKLIF